MSERKEVFIRLFVALITGIILGVWRWLIFIFILFNFFYTLVIGNRNREMAELSEIWNTQWYIYQRYIIFQSNRRPFPFGHLEKSMSRHDKRLAHHFKKKNKKRR